MTKSIVKNDSIDEQHEVRKYFDDEDAWRKIHKFVKETFAELPADDGNDSIENECCKD